MRNVAIVFVALCAASIAPLASADALDDMHVLVGLERATGIAFTHVEESTQGRTTTTSFTSGNLLWTTSGATLHSTPRFAFDGIVGEHFTLGGAIGYGSEGGSRDDPDGTTTDLGTLTTFGVSPRVGVLYPISAAVYVWPRVGMTYFTETLESSNGRTSTKTDVDGVSIDLEPSLAIFPVPHFGVLLQASFALPVAGTAHMQGTTGGFTTTSPDVDSRVRSIGLFAGVIGAF